MAKEEKKIFVLDTNIPLQDPNCLIGFKEHDICIPITVLEELDKFKKGNETKNLNARTFLRSLSKVINNPKTCSVGASLGSGLGKVFIELGSSRYPKTMESAFMEDTPDHRILAAAISLKDKRPSYSVIIVTNDINFKVKAIAMGVETEGYKNETVTDMDKIYTSITEVKFSDSEWNKLYQKQTSKKKKENAIFDNKSFPVPASLKKYPLNHLFIIKGEEGSNFRFLVRKTERLEIIQEEDLKIKEITPRNPEQSFALSALLDPQINLIALTGKAGTGKTLVALAAALHQRKIYTEILVARPAMEMSDKTLGFLPGNKEEKIDPYMMPIYDNLAVIRERIESEKEKENEQPIRDWAKANQIEVLVLNYVRGRSLSERFIIIDEAQNLTPHEIKTIITRAGEGTKIVVIGDITQIDSPYQNERRIGLSYLIDKWKGEPEFVHVHMVHGERSPLADKAGRIMWITQLKKALAVFQPGFS